MSFVSWLRATSDRKRVLSLRLGLLLLAVNVALLCGCQARKRQAVEVAPQQPVGAQVGEPGVTRVPGDGDPSTWEPTEEPGDGTAVLQGTFTEEQLQPYVDLNAKLDYSFTYLVHKDSGEIQFKDQKADIIFKDLTIGQSGTLTMEILENDVVVLRGEQKDLTLKAGRNEMDLTLREVGDDDETPDGDQKAELVLTLKVEGKDDGPDTPPPSDPPNNDPPDPGTGRNFTEIAQIAKDACSSCHPGADAADWWDNEPVKTKAQITAALDGSGSLPMPPAGTRQANELDSTTRKKLIEYVR